MPVTSAGRRATLTALVSLALFLAPGGSALAQPGAPSFPASIAELVRVNEDTYAFRSGGYVSMFVTTSDGVIVVDPIGGGNNRRNPEALKAAIATVTAQPVRYLVYSHAAADHGTGGAVFAETAEFVAQPNAADTIAARNDPTTPVPTILVEDSLSLELGGKTVQLRASARNPRDDYLTVHYRNVLMAVDNIRLRSIAFADIGGANPEQFIEFIDRMLADPDWEFFIYGHATGTESLGSRADALDHRDYYQDLTNAVQMARDEGLADNSEEMVAAVRALLAPRYGSWSNFTNGLAANVRGVLRWWSP